jgi:hypothetical protein
MVKPHAVLLPTIDVMTCRHAFLASLKTSSILASTAKIDTRWMNQ